MGLDVTLVNGMGCPVVVHYWVDLKSVHGFRCSDNIHVRIQYYRPMMQYKCVSIVVNTIWTTPSPVYPNPIWVAACRKGSIVGRISEVAVRLAQSVLR